jgi:ankyrin repeat protein
MSHASENGYVAIVAQLLNSHAKIESKDNLGQIPLSWALWRGHTAAVEFLLQNKADINSEDGFGTTPQSWATWKERLTAVDLQLDAKEELCFKYLLRSWITEKWGTSSEEQLSHQFTATNAMRYLLTKTVVPHPIIVKLLLVQGADIVSKDACSRTMLSYASEQGEESVVKLLLEKGADLNSEMETAMRRFFGLSDVVVRMWLSYSWRQEPIPTRKICITARRYHMLHQRESLNCSSRRVLI